MRCRICFGYDIWSSQELRKWASHEQTQWVKKKLQLVRSNSSMPDSAMHSMNSIHALSPLSSLSSLRAAILVARRPPNYEEDEDQRRAQHQHRSLSSFELLIKEYCWIQGDSLVNLHTHFSISSHIRRGQTQRHSNLDILHHGMPVMSSITGCLQLVWAYTT